MTGWKEEREKSFWKKIAIQRDLKYTCCNQAD